MPAATDVVKVALVSGARCRKFQVSATRRNQATDRKKAATTGCRGKAAGSYARRLPAVVGRVAYLLKEVLGKKSC